ncbi:MAG: hypothetical protein ABIR50_03640 [Ginsengibacter sp.]
MESNEEEYPEPPELRKKGMPPLKKQIKFVTIAIAVAFIIVMIFALAFWLHNKK